MKAKLKHILIKVKELKTGYIVFNDNLFGIVTSIEGRQSKVKFGDTENVFDTNALKKVVVKFIAIMKDNKSYSIVYGDFDRILSYLDTREKVEKFINRNNVTLEGCVKKIYALPKIGDVVEVDDVTILDQNPSMLSDKLERIGIVNAIVNNKYSVRFPSRELTLKKTSFDILNTLDNKYVFQLES